MNRSICVLKIACLAVTAGSCLFVPRAFPQMQTGTQMKNYDEVFNLKKGGGAAYSVALVHSSADGNVLYPGEQPNFTFLLRNTGDKPLYGSGKVDVIAYGTRGNAGDIWRPEVVKLRDLPPVPFAYSLPPKGSQTIVISATLPDAFGAYALVTDLGANGRQFATTCVRTFATASNDLPSPTLSLDEDAGIPVLRRLGIRAVRLGFNYTPSGTAGYAEKLAALEAKLKELHDNHITAMLMFLGAGDPAAQPLGMPRPHLDTNAVMQTKTYFRDYAWLPKYDEDFTRLVASLCRNHGWPKGPITAMEIWNEPWEGSSISGWGADMLRFREIYTAMAKGAEEARHDGENVLLAGCDSSSNTLDKLFPDGTDAFLKWFDVCAIHYQGPTAPSVYKKWVNRQSPNGRVKVWDTESWVANTDDRVAAVLAADRAFGYDRVLGVYAGNVSRANEVNVAPPGQPKKNVVTYDAWSTAASEGAASHFLGERRFRELLFKNGLPWIMIFDGLNNQPQDGTVVVVGDLGADFERNILPFRTVHGLSGMKEREKLRAQVSALAPDAPERKDLEKQLSADLPLSGATLTLDNPNDEFVLFDFYGNAVAPSEKITVPLDSRGFFLRTTGKPGSFERLTAALAQSRIEGYEPVSLVAHDLLSPVSSQGTLRLTVTNILNRVVTGKLAFKLGELSLTVHSSVSLQPQETREVAIPIQNVTPRDDNTYPLQVRFDSDADGSASLEENLHVNVIAKRTITVDGSLDDWKGVLPQPVQAGEQGRTLMESAWLPFAKPDASIKSGSAHGYLAYDDAYFYFAAEILDRTPSAGTLRFATRDQDADFYPEETKQIAPNVEHHWPEGVRRYSYRQDPVLPFGSFPKFDNVQIAFNVIPPDKKQDMLPCPPGTMPGFVPAQDTDYEYALNPVATAYGGGTEIWRSLVPGMPRKHFYPRQPASPYDGAVTGGKLAINQNEGKRVVEAALPWKEIPEVRKAIEAGKTIKFSFRVNDNDGPSMELTEGRSVASRNSYTFHPDWIDHWSNEVEFSFEK